MLSPKSAAEAALVETLTAIEDLRRNLDSVAKSIDTSVSPVIDRLEAGCKAADAVTNRIESACTATTQASDLLTSALAAVEDRSAALPPRIRSDLDKAKRFTLAELLLAATIAMVAGALIAATLQLQVAGLTH